MSHYKKESSLLNRLQSSTLLNHTARDHQRLTDAYPTTPHVLFTTLKKLDTNLNDLHLSFGRLEENKNTCPQLKAQRELLEAKHLFTATSDSKWDPVTFLNWTHDLRNLVLDHFTNFKANNKGSFYVPKTFLEANAHTGFEQDPLNPFNDHSAALLTNADILTKHPYCAGPDQTDDLHMHVMNAYPQLASASRNQFDPYAVEAANSQINQLVSTYSIQIQKIQQALSHECERLILRCIPKGEASPIFKQILFYRQTSIDSARQNQMAFTYNASLTIEFLRFHMVGTSMEMAIRESFAAIKHTRLRKQDLLSWSRSFRSIHARLLAHGVSSTDYDGTTKLLDLFYRTPFVHQLSAKELGALRNGGFFKQGLLDFDKDEIEAYFTANPEEFPKEVRTDSRVQAWLTHRETRLSLPATSMPAPLPVTNQRHKSRHTQQADVNYAHKESVPWPGRNTPYTPRGNAKSPYAKGHTPAPSRYAKGKQGKATRYGDRSPKGGPYGKGTPNPKHHPSSKGKPPGKGKPSHKPKLCWFCNKEGHVRADCYGYKALQSTVAYTSVRELLPDHELEDFALVIDGIGNPYCPVCNHPDCVPGPNGCEFGASAPLLAMQCLICSDSTQNELYGTILDIKRPPHQPITRELLVAQHAESHDPYGLDYASSLAYPAYHPRWDDGNPNNATPQDVYHVDHEENPSNPGTEDEDTGSTSSGTS